MGPEDAHPGYYTCGVMVVYQHGFENTYGEDSFFAKPAVFLNFGASPGDAWKVDDWGTVKLESKGIEVTVPAGTFQNCIKLKMVQDVGPPQYFSTWYLWTAPGVGGVKWIDPNGIVWELKSYELH